MSLCFCSVPRFFCVLMGAGRPNGPRDLWTSLNFALNVLVQTRSGSHSIGKRWVLQQLRNDRYERNNSCTYGEARAGWALLPLMGSTLSPATVSFLCAGAAARVSQSQKGVSVGELSRAAIVCEEEVKVGGFCRHWSIVCKHLDLEQEKALPFL